MSTPYERELDRIIEETGMGRMQAHNHLRQRNKLRSMPKLRLVASPGDVTDAAQFPEIAAAIEWAKKRREAAALAPELTEGGE